MFLERPEDPVSATYRREEIEALERELLGVAAGALRGEFTVTDEPCIAVCSGCPAEGGLCSWPIEMTRRERPDPARPTPASQADRQSPEAEADHPPPEAQGRLFQVE